MLFYYGIAKLLYSFIRNNETYYYVRDILQNIIGIIDKNGKLVVKYDYTAYGQLKSISGDNITLAHANPFRYKGYYYDSDLGMYYCKSRYYNPIWCRWLKGDHVAYLDLEHINSMNLFSYCANNPITYIDEDGNFLGIGMMIVYGLAALLALAVLSTVLVNPNDNQELITALDDGLNFIAEAIKMVAVPSSLSFVALDNVIMSKKTNPNPNKRPDQKKQGREEGNKARYKDNWESRSNYRNPRKRKKHTPGKDHRKFFKVILLFLLLKGLERF